MAGATYGQFVNACTETRDGVSFSLADQGAREKVYYLGPNFRYEKPQTQFLNLSVNPSI